MVIPKVVPKNKRGWIKVLEAFIAVVMLISVMLLIVNNEKYEAQETSSVLIKESAFLSSVQKNETMRNDILALDTSSSEYELNDSGFPASVKNYLDETFSDRIECSAKICGASSECDLNDYPEREIFSRSVIITSNLNEFDPKKLSLFCYRN